MDIYTLNISDKIESNFLGELKHISLETRIQIQKYKRRDDAMRKLYSELMIRNIIKEKLSLEDKQIHIGKNTYGKPFLVGYPKFKYNISHSGEWVVCAVADTEIGIDVEQVKEIDLDIARRFFAEEEVNYLFNQSKEEQKESFFDLWTLKESYIKQIGMGLSMNLKDFSIAKRNGNWIVHRTTQDTRTFFRQYDLHPQYKLAVCAQEKYFPQHMIYFSDA